MSNAKKTLYKYYIISSTILGIITISILYLINISIIAETYAQVEGILEVTIVILIRTLIMSLMTIYMFREWFKQEALFLDDIPFLLALFFLLVTFGKPLDLLYNLIFFALEESIAILLLKLRFIVIISSVAPVIYLCLDIFLFSLSNRYKKLGIESYAVKVKKRLICVIFGIQLFLIIIGPSITYISILLPIFALLSFTGIVYIFIIAYKGKRLSRVNPLVLAIGFLLIMISSFIRPILQIVLGTGYTSLIISELIDLVVVYPVIFIEFLLKVDYNA